MFGELARNQDYFLRVFIQRHNGHCKTEKKSLHAV